MRAKGADASARAAVVGGSLMLAVAFSVAHCPECALASCAFLAAFLWFDFNDKNGIDGESKSEER